MSSAQLWLAFGHQTIAMMTTSQLAINLGPTPSLTLLHWQLARPFCLPDSAIVAAFCALFWFRRATSDWGDHTTSFPIVRCQWDHYWQLHLSWCLFPLFVVIFWPINSQTSLTTTIITLPIASIVMPICPIGLVRIPCSNCVHLFIFAFGPTNLV